MRRYCIRKELLVPVETHDKDVVALVAGGTTPAHKYAMLKKSFFRESGPVFNRISHCCVPYLRCLTGQSMYPNNVSSVRTKSKQIAIVPLLFKCIFDTGS
jgi:hypothetical protein